VSTGNLIAHWRRLSEAELLRESEVDTYRASGPGGQKRNKTSSAVRLRHLPSGLIVIAEESRSQHENKAKALRRLKRATFLDLRDIIPADLLKPELVADMPAIAVAIEDGSLHLRAKEERFWPAAGAVLDLLAAVSARVSDAAALLGISTGNLVSFLETDPKLWQQANNLRASHGQKPLR